MRVSGPIIRVFGPVLAGAAALGGSFEVPRAAAQEADPPELTLDEVIDLVRVSGPKLSPDGSRVLFTRSELDWEKNRRDSRIWVVGADGSNMRPFTGSTDDRSPEWSPDGRWVSFTRPVGEGDGRRRQLVGQAAEGGSPIGNRDGFSAFVSGPCRGVASHAGFLRPGVCGGLLTRRTGTRRRTGAKTGRVPPVRAQSPQQRGTGKGIGALRTSSAGSEIAKIPDRPVTLNS